MNGRRSDPQRPLERLRRDRQRLGIPLPSAEPAPRIIGEAFAGTRELLSRVPAERITTFRYGVGRGNGVGRGRGVTLGVAVGVAVAVADGVGVGVADGVAVGVAEGVTVAVAVGVGVGVGVGPPRAAEDLHRR